MALADFGRPYVGRHVRTPGRPTLAALTVPLRTAGRAAGALCLVAVVLAGIALVGVPKATGSVPLTVLSGSMSPAYAPGDVVVVRPAPAESLTTGDVVTFQPRTDDPTVVTHRIIAVTVAADGSRGFVTQGDANSTPDPDPITAAQVHGRVWYSVPYVGHLSAALAGVHRDLVATVTGGALLGYGGYLLVTGAGARWRSRPGRRLRGRGARGRQPFTNGAGTG